MANIEMQISDGQYVRSVTLKCVAFRSNSGYSKLLSILENWEQLIEMVSIMNLQVLEGKWQIHNIS
jgi:hypothetical protein